MTLMNLGISQMPLSITELGHTTGTEMIQFDSDPRISRALNLLSSQLSRKPLDDVARELNLSSSRLRHILRDATGVSPRRFVKHQRLLRAKELLETTFLSVKEVMSTAGLTDMSHFVRDYKLTFGETPSQTRDRASHFD